MDYFRSLYSAPRGNSGPGNSSPRTMPGGEQSYGTTRSGPIDGDADQNRQASNKEAILKQNEDIKAAVHQHHIDLSRSYESIKLLPPPLYRDIPLVCMVFKGHMNCLEILFLVSFLTGHDFLKELNLEQDPENLKDKGGDVTQNRFLKDLVNSFKIIHYGKKDIDEYKGAEELNVFEESYDMLTNEDFKLQATNKLLFSNDEYTKWFDVKKITEDGKVYVTAPYVPDPNEPVMKTFWTAFRKVQNKSLPVNKSNKVFIRSIQ